MGFWVSIGVNVIIGGATIYQMYCLRTGNCAGMTGPAQISALIRAELVAQLEIERERGARRTPDENGH